MTTTACLGEARRVLSVLPPVLKALR